MKRMLSLACCCYAAAGVLVTVTATNNASRPSQTCLAVIIISFPQCLTARVLTARYGPGQPAPKLQSPPPTPIWKQSQPCDTPRKVSSSCSILFLLNTYAGSGHMFTHSLCIEEMLPSAAAGMLAIVTAANNASRPSQMCLAMFLVHYSPCWLLRRAGSLRPITNVKRFGQTGMKAVALCIRSVFIVRRLSL
jgi:hypothetical protein